jgi:anti-sigma-K factor RskA
MNTPRNHLEPDVPRDDELFAAEYALGVLDANERLEAQARIARDPAFAALVDAWDARFAAWLLRVQPQAPGAHVWPRVRTSLGWAPVGNDRRAGHWNDVRTWRLATALAAAAAIAAISFALLQRPAPVAPPPVVVAPPAPAPTEAARPVTVLERDDGSTGWIASIDANAAKLRMVPVPVPADAQGRVHELWVIPAGQAPISLGLVSNDKAQTIDVPSAVRAALRVGATLAVTLEPQAGIPHAAPSGPIVAKGGISQI